MSSLRLFNRRKAVCEEESYEGGRHGSVDTTSKALGIMGVRIAGLPVWKN